MPERLDMRVLGGVRVVDHITGQPIRDGIAFRNTDLRFGPTPSGTWAIRMAPGYDAYVKAYDPVPAVAPRDFAFEIHDLKRRFWPVIGRISLPRSVDDANPALRVDTPVTLALASTPARRAVAGWTVINVSVEDQDGAPVAGALVQVLEDGSGDELGWSVSGPNGVALVPLTGIARLLDTPDDGDEDTVDLITAVTRVRISATADVDRPWPADPATLRAGGATIRNRTEPETVDLIASGTARKTVTLTLN